MRFVLCLHNSLFFNIQLFHQYVFQIHLLNEEVRGPVLEAVVSRMKTIQVNLYKKYYISIHKKFSHYFDFRIHVIFQTNQMFPIISDLLLHLLLYQMQKIQPSGSILNRNHVFVTSKSINNEFMLYLIINILF